MKSEYVGATTGNELERLPAQFWWRGRTFSGLVDVATHALYDDPADSFAEHVGMPSSLAKGLIALAPALRRT